MLLLNMIINGAYRIVVDKNRYKEGEENIMVLKMYRKETFYQLVNMPNLFSIIY